MDKTEKGHGNRIFVSMLPRKKPAHITFGLHTVYKTNSRIH